MITFILQTPDGEQRQAMRLNMTNDTLNQSYDDFPRIEEEFATALDESLHPRGPALLYDIVASLGLVPTSTALDVGCG